MFSSLSIYKFAQAVSTALVVFEDRWAAVVDRNSGAVLSRFQWETLVDYPEIRAPRSEGAGQ